jgi:hypothetical protein
MITTKFDWREDREFGGFGWILQGFPNFNVSQGLGIAHDTLEHFKNGDGSLTHEMLAFGSMLFTRVECCWFSSRGNYRGAIINLSSDIMGFLRDVYYGNSNVLKPPKTRKLDDYLEDEIKGVMSKGYRDATQEYEVTDDMSETIQRMVGWMRIGYRKAKRRFHGNTSDELGFLFDEIVRTVDEKFKHGNEGETLVVKVNPRTLQFNIFRTETSFY